MRLCMCESIRFMLASIIHNVRPKLVLCVYGFRCTHHVNVSNKLIYTLCKCKTFHPHPCKCKTRYKIV